MESELKGKIFQHIKTKTISKTTNYKIKLIEKKNKFRIKTNVLTKRNTKILIILQLIKYFNIFLFYSKFLKNNKRFLEVLYK